MTGELGNLFITITLYLKRFICMFFLLKGICSYFRVHGYDLQFLANLSILASFIKFSVKNFKDQVKTTLRHF